MFKHSKELQSKIKTLRRNGKTYREINNILKIHLAKSTLHWICRNTLLPKSYRDKITKLNISNLGIARATALAIRQTKREEFYHHIKVLNTPIAQRIYEKDVTKIALSMLCLGEASKSTSSRVFCLGNSDIRIITLFIKFLRICFDDFDPKKIRCTVQCRADQNIKQLEAYWQKSTKIPTSQFYKSRIDPRTMGIPTKKKDYMGVLKVDYLDKKVQLELEYLANLIYNIVHSRALSSFG